MIRKVFVSRTGVELSVKAMSAIANELFLEIKDGDTSLDIYLDDEDHADLIRELQKLQKIKKQIAE